MAYKPEKLCRMVSEMGCLNIGMQFRNFRFKIFCSIKDITCIIVIAVILKCNGSNYTFTLLLLLFLSLYYTYPLVNVGFSHSSPCLFICCQIRFRPATCFTIANHLFCSLPTLLLGI